MFKCNAFKWTTAIISNVWDLIISLGSKIFKFEANNPQIDDWIASSYRLQIGGFNFFHHSRLTDRHHFFFALASSAESCGVLLSNGVNYAQSITFSITNVATVIVTDIVNAGTFSVDGNIITVTLPNSDSENPMTFNANTEVTELILISYRSNDIWKLAIEGIDS